MPHSPKPFFKAKRNAWYVEVDRVQHLLGKHPDGLPPPHKRGGQWMAPEPILNAFYKKMAELQERPAHPDRAKPPIADAVVFVIEHFLDWCQEHRAAETYEWYRWRLQRFAEHVGRSLSVAQLKHLHIDAWLKKHPDWSSGTKHGMARAVMRAMRWAKKKGYIDHNPIADYEKPRPGKRRLIVSSETFEKMLALAGSQEFRDLLVFTWETAARPQESLVAEARHVELAGARLVFPPDETKGEQWPRIIYLTETALRVVRRLMLCNPHGPIFRNSDGTPWTTDAVNCAFQRLQVRMGMEQLKAMKALPEPIAKPPRQEWKRWTQDVRRQYRAERQRKVNERRRMISRLARQDATKYSLYTLRHSWATHALAKGVDALTVAILMGHRDPSTLARVYQHLTQNPQYLLEAAKKAVG